MILGTVLSAKNILAGHLNDKVRGTLAYKIMKFIHEVEVEERFSNAEIPKILEKYAEKDSDGKLVYEDGGYKIPPENIDKFQAEIDALHNTEVESPRVSFILGDFEDLSVSANEMWILSQFMKED